MKTLSLYLVAVLLPIVALAQNINVQKAASTNAITGNLNFPDGRTLSFGTTTPGTITGSLGSLTFTAAGANQSFNFIPSGTGMVSIIGGDTATLLSVRRTTASTNTRNIVGSFYAVSTGDMTDGFGPSTGYFIRDTAGVDNNIGAFGAIRSGADNSGAIVGIARLLGVSVGVFMGMPSQNLLVKGLTVEGTGAVQFPNHNSADGGIALGTAAFVYAQVSGGRGTNVSGSATNDDAPAGYYGEFVSSTVASASAVALTTATTANVTSISLTAGDWNVWGNVYFTQGATTTATAYSAGVSQTTATLPGNDGGNQVNLAGTGAALLAGNPAPTLTTPTGRISLTGTTTIFLTAQSTFLISTQAAFGTIRARRVR